MLAGAVDLADPVNETVILFVTKQGGIRGHGRVIHTLVHGSLHGELVLDFLAL